MALVLPSSIDYASGLPALPDAAQFITVAQSPINGSSFSQGQQIIFDLLSRSFLDPTSMYLSYSFSAPTTAAGIGWRATPAYSAFNRCDIQIGSITVDTIQQYGLVSHLLVNSSLNVADKYGLQSAYGYGTAAGGVPSLEELDGRGLANGPNTGSVSVPLISLLSNCEKLIPLFAMPQVRVILTMDSLSNIFTTTTGLTSFTINNVELRYRLCDMSPAVEQMVMNMGDKLYIKSQSFSCASQTLPSGAVGYNELVFNQRFSSVKSLFAVNGSASVNGFYDSVDITSNNGDYSFQIAGQIVPSKPISTSTAKSQALMEFKTAVGSIFDRSNTMSINSVEFGYVSGNTTTLTAPGKFFIGTSTERLNSESLLTGISTANSPISYRVNIGTATAAASTVSLIVNYDALIEVDTMTRQASVKA